MPAGSVVLYSGTDGALNGFGVVRFTVPAAGVTEDGQYAVEVTVRPLFDGPLAGDTDFRVVRNGEELFRRDLAPNESASYSDTLSLTAGDTIDFVVGRGQDRSGRGSGLKIEATITALGAGAEPPIVTGQPQDVTVGVGETASFGVVTSGNPAPTFQWLFNGAPLAGETNSSLVLSNVQPSQAGNYAVIAANAAGSATSSNAVLTVMPLPECVPVVPALVAWWPFDGTANDLFGTNHGAVIDTPVFTSGQVQEGLRFVLGSAVRVPASPSLDLGAGSGLRLELWIKPSASDLARQSPLIEWTDNRSIIGLLFWSSVSSPVSGGGPGSLFAGLIDTAGVSRHFSSAPHLLVSNVFQHVALTYDKGSGLARLFLNGSQVAQTSVGNIVLETRPDVYFGRRPLGSSAGDQFLGLMDEVSFFRRALSATEIEAIYSAGVAGKCKTDLPPFNLPPVAVSQSVGVDEDIPTPITLSASDPEGDALTFAVTRPAHGTLAGVAPNLVYAPAPNYSGPDGFIFTVSDGELLSALATVSIAVRPVNDAPVARATVEPLAHLDPESTDRLIISPNNSNAVVILDGSRSTDADRDTLEYYWLEPDTNAVFATGRTATVTLDVGEYTLALAVSDGASFGRTSLSFEVITAGDAVEILASMVREASLSSKDTKALLQRLRLAGDAFDRGDFDKGVRELTEFNQRVEKSVRSADPALADQLVRAANEIIQAVSGE